MKVLDREDLMERVGGDCELADELLDMFRDEALRLREVLSAAVAADDATAVAEAAHSLKGSAGNVSAQGVQEAASTLEQLGREGTLRGGAGESLERLSVAIDALLEHLGANAGA